MLHGHGDDLTGDVINFSSNVWKEGFSAGLGSHLLSCISKVTRYPEVLAESLLPVVADHYKLNASQVLITNGATEAIYLVAHAFSRSKTAVVVPSFAEYEDACTLYHHQLSFIRERDFKDEADCEVLFFCNPNNPTGKAYPVEFVEKLLQNNPDTIVVIDEAYSDFTLCDCSSVSLLSRYPNLILLRSVTKHYAIPGLRLGFLLSNSDIIEKIKACKMPWSVNTLAIEAGQYILANPEEFQMPIGKLLTISRMLRDAIGQIPGFSVHPSDTTFFTAHTEIRTAALLKRWLYDEYKILIRDASNFRGLNSSSFRIASQSVTENALLINALKEWSAFVTR
jgi:threonine-phosphate decarboxylase